MAADVARKWVIFRTLRSILRQQAFFLAPHNGGVASPVRVVRSSNKEFTGKNATFLEREFQETGVGQREVGSTPRVRVVRAGAACHVANHNEPGRAPPPPTPDVAS